MDRCMFCRDITLVHRRKCLELVLTKEAEWEGPCMTH